MGNWVSITHTCPSQYTFVFEFPYGTILGSLVFVLSLIGLYHTVLSIARLASPVSDTFGSGFLPFLPLRWRPRIHPASHRARRTPRPQHRPAITDSSPLSPGSLAILAPAHNPPPALVQALNEYQALNTPLVRAKPLRPSRPRRRST